MQLKNHSTRHAFTLIELLVVISILALMIAILLPTLTSARGAAYNAKCQANLHGIGLAVHLYINENRNYFSPYFTAAMNTPDVHATGFNSLMGCWGTATDCYYPWQAYLFYYGGDIRSWIDPANKWPVNGYTENPAGVTGDATGEPLPDLDGILWWGNYGCNQSVFSYTSYWQRLDSQRAQAETNLSACAGGYEIDTTYVGLNSGYYYLPGAGAFGPAWTPYGATALDQLRQVDCDTGRHPGYSINSLLLDGHARSYKSADLYAAWLAYAAGGYTTRTELSTWWSGLIQ